MILLAPREPVSAWSHAFGLILALAASWIFWQRCSRRVRLVETAGNPLSDVDSAYERGKVATMLIFGFSLVVCYGASTLYHAAWAGGSPLSRLRRLDHVGIYLLIAGTYTPASWSLLAGAWRRGTLATVWGVAGACALRVWVGGVLPPWVSTLIYLSMGWGVIFCYRELARDLGHRTLLPLPLGGAFYSVGAVINLAGWPVPAPGSLGAHDLFHFFVMAGSACHVTFMLRTVIPASRPAGWLGRRPALNPPHFAARLSRVRPAPGRRTGAVGPGALTGRRSA